MVKSIGNVSKTNLVLLNDILIRVLELVINCLYLEDYREHLLHTMTCGYLT